MAKCVLVVDDSEVARQELIAPIKAAGFAPIEAENGSRACERVAAGGVDLVVTDVHMPIMNGIEMCESLAKTMGDKMPPVLVVSTEASPEMKTRGKAAGVKGWVIKPVDTAKLVTVISMLLGKGKGG